MLTVAEALQLPAFAGARVVAGTGGLHKTVHWVHNVGVPNAAEWLNGGELMLTTAINMPTGEAEQQRYLQDLIDKGVVGLVITVGQMMDRVPEYLYPIADANNFPLIEISYKARFVDIARTANEKIIQENMAIVSRALAIQQTLTQLVLEGGGIKQLAETLAGLIHQSISIENDRFEALASVNIAPVDEARRYTQQYGRTDPRLVRALEDQILPAIRRTLRPVFIPQMPHVGLEMERILAPIVVHGEIYGYVWIIADERPVSDLDHMAIESAATIAALMLIYQDSIRSAEASLKGSLITRLIQGESADVMGDTDQALRYGVDLRQPFRMLLIESPDTTAQRLVSLQRRMNQLANKHRAITGQYTGQVLMLIQATADLPALVQAIQHAAEGVRLGISAQNTGADKVSRAHMQCREVLEIRHKLQLTDRVVYFESLGYLHTLYQAGPGALSDNLYSTALRTLQAEQQADLFHTLETYLDAGGNGVSTAELLHIHRSTLNYRLQRIAEICHADLSDPATRLDLQIALKLMRLFGV
ncbi:MAG: PucR family transcriptional regulator [Anaerolineae bacterium]